MFSAGYSYVAYGILESVTCYGTRNLESGEIQCKDGEPLGSITGLTVTKTHSFKVNSGMS